jgi:hypothetical protein
MAGEAAVGAKQSREHVRRGESGVGELFPRAHARDKDGCPRGTAATDGVRSPPCYCARCCAHVLVTGTGHLSGHDGCQVDQT